MEESKSLTTDARTVEHRDESMTRMNEAEMRQLYVDVQPGDFVEIVHHIKIGFKEHSTHTVGVVVKKERRRSGMDGGFARHWDDKYWFDHLTLRKDDGELTTVTMDEYTDLRRLGELQST